jgi:hypothetical protein
MPRTVAAEGSGDGKRHPLNMRTTKELRDLLEASAQRSGRSLAQEVEARVQTSFEIERRADERQLADVFGNREVFGIVKLIARAMNEVGRVAGFRATFTLEAAEHWLDNPYAYDQATRAVAHILEEFRPAGEVKLPSYQPRVIGDDLPGAPSLEDELSNLGVGVAESMLEEAATGRSRVMAPQKQELASEHRRDIGPALAERLKLHVAYPEEDHPEQAPAKVAKGRRR